MERHEIQIDDPRCRNDQHVIRALEHDETARAAFAKLLGEFNKQRAGEPEVRAEDVVRVWRGDTLEQRIRGARPVDIRAFWHFANRHLVLRHGDAEASMLQNTVDTVQALSSIADPKMRRFNHIARVFQGMLHQLLLNADTQIQRQNARVRSAAEAPLTEAPDVATLVRECEPDDLARDLYEIFTEEQRRKTLERLRDAAKAADTNWTKVMGPIVRGVKIVLVDTLMEDTPCNRAAVAHYVRFLQAQHPDFAIPPSPEEMQSIIGEDPEDMSWLSAVSAGDLGHHFFENVSRRHRQTAFARVLVYVTSVAGDQAGNEELAGLRSVDGQAATFARAFAEVQRLLSSAATAQS
jgi:hypothetical protein